jgi:hypothetical protein
MVVLMVQKILIKKKKKTSINLYLMTYEMKLKTKMHYSVPMILKFWPIDILAEVHIFENRIET